MSVELRKSNPHDWPEMHKYWHSHCSGCRESFCGPKRAPLCWACENSEETKRHRRLSKMASLEEHIRDKEAEIHGMQAELEKLRKEVQ